MKTLKLAFSNLSRKFILLPLAVSSLVMMGIPSFAAVDPTLGVLADDAFDPLLTAIVSNIGVILPGLLIVAGLVIAISLGFSLIKKHAKA